mmetsp:Transcript_13945/g.20669  ORF Transcript_13945/g.20669 Transcript_13945/m.20669 type:complete len:87 (+) Transcript_13945:31-291(+)
MSNGQGITQDQADQLLNQARFESEQANVQEMASKLTQKCFSKCAKTYKGNRLDSSEQSCIALCMDRYMDVFSLVNKAIVEREAMRG